MKTVSLRRIEPEKKQGLVVVVTGNGKGKTTSALGMILRAVGYDMRVCLVQFVKGDLFSGEYEALKKLSVNVEHHLTGRGFCGIMGNNVPLEEHRTSAQKGLELAKTKMTSGKFDVVVCDEVHNALQLKLLDLDQVVALIKAKPSDTHLVLTGREAPSEIIGLADTVSEIQEVKHAYRKGIEPQKGIDY